MISVMISACWKIFTYNLTWSSPVVSNVALNKVSRCPYDERAPQRVGYNPWPTFRLVFSSQADATLSLALVLIAINHSSCVLLVVFIIHRNLPHVVLAHAHDWKINHTVATVAVFSSGFERGGAIIFFYGFY